MKRILAPGSPGRKMDLIHRIHSNSRSPVNRREEGKGKGKKRRYGVNALTESMREPLGNGRRQGSSPPAQAGGGETRKHSATASSRLRFSQSRQFTLLSGEKLLRDK